MLIFQNGDKLIFKNEGRELVIEPFGCNALRVYSTANNAPPRKFALYNGTYDASRFCIKQSPAQAEITNGRLTCVVSSEGELAFFNQHGKELTKEYSLSRVLGVPARDIKYKSGGDMEVTLRLTAEPDEKFYGMGQYQHGFLNLKGMQLELAQRNTQASVPFAVSSNGYGILWNNPAVGNVFFGKDHTEWTAKSTMQLDYWITAGDTPAEIVQSYGAAVGTAPMMPDYAMGFWQSKLRYKSQFELMRIAKAYKKRGLPLSVIVVDFFHWPHFGDWKFDKRYWPDVCAMVNSLKKMGIELAVSVWPSVETKSENYAQMQEKGYLISAEHGLPYCTDFPSNSLFYDSTNPDARKFVWSKLKANYFSKGIRTFWLDAIEPEYKNYDYESYRFLQGTAMQVGNSYPAFCTKAVYDGLIESGIADPVSLCRCAWAGSQRYGALVWSGDVASTFEVFRKQLAAGLNMGLAGIPWWTTDIGGFSGGDIKSAEFRELLIRWFQFGTYCPVMRLHGDRQKSCGRQTIYNAENEIWSFGDEAYTICKKYLQIRENMRPYIRSLMRQAHENGAPVMRTLFYEFPHDAKAWEVEDVYMLGSDYLVAPVFEYGARVRRVYLPAGADWTEMETGKQYAGGREITVDAPLDVIPVFARDRT